MLSDPPTHMYWPGLGCSKVYFKVIYNLKTGAVLAALEVVREPMQRNTLAIELYRKTISI